MELTASQTSGIAALEQLEVLRQQMITDQVSLGSQTLLCGNLGAGLSTGISQSLLPTPRYGLLLSVPAVGPRM